MTFLAFEIVALRKPSPDDALARGRVIAERSNATIQADAQPRITQRDDDPWRYRIEVPATFA